LDARRNLTIHTGSFSPLLPSIEYYLIFDAMVLLLVAFSSAFLPTRTRAAACPMGMMSKRRIERAGSHCEHWLSTTVQYFWQRRGAGTCWAPVVFPRMPTTEVRARTIHLGSRAKGAGRSWWLWPAAGGKKKCY